MTPNDVADYLTRLEAAEAEGVSLVREVAALPGLAAWDWQPQLFDREPFRQFSCVDRIPVPWPHRHDALHHRIWMWQSTMKGLQYRWGSLKYAYPHIELPKPSHLSYSFRRRWGDDLADQIGAGDDP